MRTERTEKTREREIEQSGWCKTDNGYIFWWEFHFDAIFVEYISRNNSNGNNEQNYTICIGSTIFRRVLSHSLPFSVAHIFNRYDFFHWFLAQFTQINDDSITSTSFLSSYRYFDYSIALFISVLLFFILFICLCSFVCLLRFSQFSSFLFSGFTWLTLTHINKKETETNKVKDEI